MQTFRDVIDRWPSLEALAQDTGANIVRVRKWRQRGNIPPEYWRGLIAGARARQITDVTADMLTLIAAAEARVA